jgi:virulence factor Mce-like protein
METRTPGIGRILVAIGFAVSCFGLLLFLWIAFGGPVPLAAEGYKVTVPFGEASQLAVGADVRISGVSVGRVSRVEGGSEGQAEATIELDSEFAPIPRDTQAILRQKTLLGETYVELTPGSEEAGSLPEDGDLPSAQVAESVQLDEVFRAFDPRTRAAFQGWMQGQAAAWRGRGEDVSVAIASLEPFADEAERALRLLDTQSQAVREFVRQGGEVFGALAERRGQLRGLIESANTVFGTTARRNEELAEAFTIFPTFLRESRATLTRLEEFAVDSDPVVTALHPTAEELEPTARELADLAPELQRFFEALPATIKAAPAGMRATRRLLDDDLPPVLGRLDGWLAPVNAILEVVRRYRRELTGLSNLAAASQGSFFDFGTETTVHYLRTESPLTPEAVAAYPQRLSVTRTNPYLRPGAFLDVQSTMQSFETRQCASGVDAFLNPASSSDPLFLERTDNDATEGQLFFDRVNLFAFNDELGTATMTPPPCNQQPAVQSVGAPSETSDYLHVRDLPDP